MIPWFVWWVVGLSGCWLVWVVIDYVADYRRKIEERAEKR